MEKAADQIARRKETGNQIDSLPKLYSGYSVAKRYPRSYPPAQQSNIPYGRKLFRFWWIDSTHTNLANIGFSAFDPLPFDDFDLATSGR